MDYDTQHILQFFSYIHLPEALQKISAPFATLAIQLATMTEDQLREQRVLVQEAQASAVITTLIGFVDRSTPPNTEATWAVVKLDEANRELLANKPLHQVLRKILEGKDCAVRALLAKPVPKGEINATNQ